MPTKAVIMANAEHAHVPSAGIRNGLGKACSLKSSPAIDQDDMLGDAGQRAGRAIVSVLSATPSSVSFLSALFETHCSSAEADGRALPRHTPEPAKDGVL